MGLPSTSTWPHGLTASWTTPSESTADIGTPLVTAASAIALRRRAASALLTTVLPPTASLPEPAVVLAEAGADALAARLQRGRA